MIFEDLEGSIDKIWGRMKLWVAICSMKIKTLVICSFQIWLDILFSF